MREPAGSNACRFRMPIREAPMTDRTCTFPDCGRKHHGQNMCYPHYMQRFRGTELRPIRVTFDNLRDKIEHGLEPDENGCWLWTGARHPRGYGHVRWGDKVLHVHRAYLKELGWDVPDEMDVDHLCRVTACANPAHLEVVTHLENVRRGNSPTAIKARQNRV